MDDDEGGREEGRSQTTTLMFTDTSACIIIHCSGLVPRNIIQFSGPTQAYKMSFSRVAKLNSHGESLFHKIIVFDSNRYKYQTEAERHLVSSLILTNRYWYKIIKSMYCRLLFEVISMGMIA